MKLRGLKVYVSEACSTCSTLRVQRTPLSSSLVRKSLVSVIYPPVPADIFGFTQLGQKNCVLRNWCYYGNNCSWPRCHILDQPVRPSIDCCLVKMVVVSSANPLRTIYSFNYYLIVPLASAPTGRQRRMLGKKWSLQGSDRTSIFSPYDLVKLLRVSLTVFTTCEALLQASSLAYIWIVRPKVNLYLSQPDHVIKLNCQLFRSSTWTFCLSACACNCYRSGGRCIQPGGTYSRNSEQKSERVERAHQ